MQEQSAVIPGSTDEVHCQQVPRFQVQVSSRFMAFLAFRGHGSTLRTAFFAVFSNLFPFWLQSRNTQEKSEK